MSKKETRRAARQAFPQAPSGAKGAKTAAKGGTGAKSGGGKIKSSAQQKLRPPTVKRAVIQGAILALLYFLLIRFVWRQHDATTASYIVFPLGGFIVYSGLSYAIDRWNYRRRLRKLQGSSK